MKLIYCSLLLLLVSSTVKEKPKLTFEYKKEVQEVKDNLELAKTNLKLLDSINKNK